MERIETGCNLHPLNLVYGFAIRENNADLIKRRPSVREFILDYQIFCFLRVNERSDEGLLRCNDRLQILQPVFLQDIFNRRVRTRCDFVDH